MFKRIRPLTFMFIVYINLTRIIIIHSLFQCTYKNVRWRTGNVWVEISYRRTYFKTMTFNGNQNGFRFFNNFAFCG